MNKFEMDLAANAFALKYKREKAFYLGIYRNGKHTYALGWNNPPKSYGGGTMIVHYDESAPDKFVFINENRVLDAIVYFGGQEH